MADYEYTLGITATVPTTVAYGATVYAPATAYAHTFVPAYGLSSLDVLSVTPSGNNSRITYSISATQAFPIRLTQTGGDSTKMLFNVGIANNGGDTNRECKFVLDMLTSGVALSAGVNDLTGTYHSSISESIAYTVTGIGLPASAITGFTATPRSNYMTLTWVNPTDLLSANIRRSLTTTVDSVLSGELIYSGTNTTYNDTSSTGLSAFFYGAYAVDTDGNVSDIVSLSAMGTGPQPPYTPSDDPTQNELDPYSLSNETYNTRRYRLEAEDII